MSQRYQSYALYLSALSKARLLENIHLDLLQNSNLGAGLALALAIEKVCHQKSDNSLKMLPNV